MATNFGIVELTATQGNKYLTHNEALRHLESLACGTVKGVLTLPPTSSIDGDLYIVGTGSTGAWTGFDEYIAKRDALTNTWIFIPPGENMRLHYSGSGGYYIEYIGGSWQTLGSSAGLTINTIQFKNNVNNGTGGTVSSTFTGITKLAFNSSDFNIESNQPGDTVCIKATEKQEQITPGKVYTYQPTDTTASQENGFSVTSTGMNYSNQALDLTIDDAVVYRRSSDVSNTKRVSLGRFGRGIQKALDPYAVSTTATVSDTHTVVDIAANTTHHVAIYPNIVVNLTGGASYFNSPTLASRNLKIYLPGTPDSIITSVNNLLTRGADTGTYKVSNAAGDIFLPFGSSDNLNHGVWRVGDSYTITNSSVRTGTFQIVPSPNMNVIYDKGLSNFTQVGALTITFIYGGSMTDPSATSASGDTATWLVQGGHA